MEWLFDNDRPIYIQLVEQLKIAILSGIYKEGERLPSVRELANDTKANPNTVQKAFVELENQGVIYTQRTNGKFVTNNKDLLISMKEQIAKDNLNNFLNNMKNLGYNNSEIKKYLSSHMKDN